MENNLSAQQQFPDDEAPTAPYVAVNDIAVDSKGRLRGFAAMSAEKKAEVCQLAADARIRLGRPGHRWTRASAKAASIKGVQSRAAKCR